MTNWTLADDYFRKARIRRKALDVFRDGGSHDDVVRESQELVELVLKGVLRQAGVDPPKWHDVGQILEENASLLLPAIRAELSRMCQLSAYLRRERELSFYGDDDFIPSQKYSDKDSLHCLAEVDWLLALIAGSFPKGDGKR